MSKFIVASKQATKMDKTRILLETRIQVVKNDYKGWAEVATKAKDEAKELQNLVEELKADIVKNDTHLDYLQKMNDELFRQDISSFLLVQRLDCFGWLYLSMDFEYSYVHVHWLDEYALNFISSVV